jgi:hypothetical protein
VKQAIHFLREIEKTFFGCLIYFTLHHPIINDRTTINKYGGS